MLLPLIARHAEEARRDDQRYAAWANALRRDGPVAERLARIPEDQREDARLDLVRADLRRRPEARIEDHALPSVPLELVEDEFLARHEHGETPGLAEYDRRFPGAADRLTRRIVAGRYVRLRLLGRGAMGAVWMAVDRKARRRVALKLPCGAFPRFREEMRLLASLSHPGIVAVHDLDDGDAPFYVMRLVEGPTLAERIRGETRRRLLERLIAVCDAVSHAHSRGVLHRDLKPGNVLAGEETVLVDWGMAGRAGFRSGEVAGTPEYMAPEQAEGASDPRSDVFGLGAILYEILCARPPLRRGAREWRIERPRGVPRALSAICLKALDRNPARRFSGAAELAEAVRRVLDAPWPVRLWHALSSMC